jgi:glutamine---fructose-6-phosphate transaminase (isomerizing)
MKSLGNFPDRFLAEIAGQPEALRRASVAMRDQADVLASAAVAAARSDAVVLTGMGSSYDACYAPVTALAAGGVACSMVDAAELLHFRLPVLTPSTLLVCISQSGRSVELVRIVERLAERASRPVLLSITNGLDNPLAAACDLKLDTDAGEEHGPSTMTFAATLVALSALAERLGAAAANGGGVERAAESVARLVAGAPERAAALSDWLGDRPALALLARGGARPAAEMGALTLKEAARFPAESIQTAQFRHGPLELAGPELAVIVISTEPATREHDLRLATELTARGSAVLVVSPDGAAPNGAAGIAIGDIDRGLASAVAVVPAQLLAWRLANLRGLTPGAYTVASKVTTIE